MDKSTVQGSSPFASSQEDTWSQTNHGGLPSNSKKRRISDPFVPTAKGKQRRTALIDLTDYIIDSEQLADDASIIAPADTACLATELTFKESQQRRFDIMHIEKEVAGNISAFIDADSQWNTLQAEFADLEIDASRPSSSNKGMDTLLDKISTMINNRTGTLEALSLRQSDFDPQKQEREALESRLRLQSRENKRLNSTVDRLRIERNALLKMVPSSEMQEEAKASSDKEDRPHQAELAEIKTNLEAARAKSDQLASRVQVLEGELEEHDSLRDNVNDASKAEKIPHKPNTSESPRDVVGEWWKVSELREPRFTADSIPAVLLDMLRNQFLGWDERREGWENTGGTEETLTCAYRVSGKKGTLWDHGSQHACHHCSKGKLVCVALVNKRVSMRPLYRSDEETEGLDVGDLGF